MKRPKLGKQWLSLIRQPADLTKPLVALNEIPEGSKCKYKLDKRTGQLKLARVLSGCQFPMNYGFLPGTASTDGEELDIMILTSEPLLPLTLVDVHVIGGFRQHTKGECKEDKFLAVAVDDPAYEHVRELEDLPLEARDQIGTFATSYKDVQGIEVTVEEWYGRKKALKRIKRGLTK